MPRQFHKITSKEDPNKEIYLNAMLYEQALEEALDKLGWVIQSEWNEPYNSMFQDEHMMSLFCSNLRCINNENKIQN